MAAWRDLTFSFGAYLTSSQLNQLQGNFEAVARNDVLDNAPKFQLYACGDWTVASSSNGSLGAGATLTPTAGLYTYIGDTSVNEWELFQGGAWQSNSSGSFGWSGANGVAAVDGSTARIKNRSSVASYLYAYFKYDADSGSGLSWTNLSFSFGAYLTAVEMLQLQDNFTAVGDGDGAAPKIINWEFDPATEGYFTLGANTVWTPTAGVYTVGGGALGQQIFQASAWRTGFGGGYGVSGLCYMDGTNYRFRDNSASATTVAYIKHS